MSEATAVETVSRRAPLTIEKAHAEYKRLAAICSELSPDASPEFVKAKAEKNAAHKVYWAMFVEQKRAEKGKKPSA